MLRLVAKTNKTDFPANAILKPPTNISVQELDDEEEEDEEEAIKDEHGPDSDGGGGGIGGRGSGSRGGRSRGGRGSSGGSSGSGDQTSLKLLVTDPELRKRQLAMVVAWMTCSLLYYGLTSAGSALTDNRYEACKESVFPLSLSSRSSLSSLSSLPDSKCWGLNYAVLSRLKGRGATLRLSMDWMLTCAFPPVTSMPMSEGMQISAGKRWQSSPGSCWHGLVLTTAEPGEGAPWFCPFRSGGLRAV